MGNYAFSHTPLLHPEYKKIKRRMYRQWQEWEALENLTKENLIDNAFDEGVINTLFTLYVVMTCKSTFYANVPTTVVPWHGHSYR